MKPIAIVAVGAVSPLGLADRAFAIGGVGDPAETRVERDAALTAAGLARPLAARVPLDERGGDRAQALLTAAAKLLVRGLDAELPGWRTRRLALCLGTSAGGMPSLERAFELRARSAPIDALTARSALYAGPLAALRPWFDAPMVQVLAACASSTVAIGLGCRWLEAERAELVIAGGYDALSDFVASGFEALGATTASGFAPFRVERDGMALGEGAALVALVRANETSRAFGHVLGFSMTNDAAHITAPDPSGRGLARAAEGALRDAATPPSEIDLVSAHATATPHNDRAEARAIAEVLGEAARSAVVHPFKASIGHCLGASGALETLAALAAMHEGVLPAAFGQGTVEPEVRFRLLARNEAGRARACLKLSSGFGGSNAALVVAPTPSDRTVTERRRRAVRVLAAGEFVTEPSFEAFRPWSVVDEARLARLSPGGALAATAMASALSGRSAPERDRVAVIVGTTVACLEENERFDKVRRERGARAVEPRRFSRTSPNLTAGECAIAFGFSGPSFAVGGGVLGPVEALVVGSDLVADGDADHALVIVCDEVGAVVRSLFSAAGLEPPPHGARALLLGTEAGASRALDRAALTEMLGRAEPAETGDRLLMAAVSRATRETR